MASAFSRARSLRFAKDHQRLVTLARDAGFTAVLDDSDAFDGIEPAALRAHSDDYHPNDKGHALLARRIVMALWNHRLLNQLQNPGGNRNGPAAYVSPFPEESADVLRVAEVGLEPGACRRVFLG